MEEEKFMEIMYKKINKKFNMVQSSYHGSNCRTCNRKPTYIRKFYWYLEDLICRIKKWYNKDEKIVYTIGDYFIN